MYRVVITARARDEADATHAWMAANFSPDHAEKWYQELLKQIESLANLPTRCPIAAESERFPEEIRELPFRPKKVEQISDSVQNRRRYRPGPLHTPLGPR